MHLRIVMMDLLHGTIVVLQHTRHVCGRVTLIREMISLLVSDNTKVNLR